MIQQESSARSGAFLLGKTVKKKITPQKKIFLNLQEMWVRSRIEEDHLKELSLC